ncbi:hypothetical protein ACHAWF_005147 [Thalassiosira exigua]
MVSSLTAGIALLSASHLAPPFASAKLADRMRLDVAWKRGPSSNSWRRRRRAESNRARPTEDGSWRRGIYNGRDAAIETGADLLASAPASNGDGGDESGHAGVARKAKGRSSYETFASYDAMEMCSAYGEDCTGGGGHPPSEPGSGGGCPRAGPFVGLSFSVNTSNGDPKSRQLNDQFPMENIVDRGYDYVMSMDEDGWLVGGGYKKFDHSGKLPYIDSSHTELLRLSPNSFQGKSDADEVKRSHDQVYNVMDSISFAPFSIFPEYLKSEGDRESSTDRNRNGIPSRDLALIVSVVAAYDEGDSYSSYERYMDDLFDAMDAVGADPCVNHDADLRVSLAKGVKFRSSHHERRYLHEINLEVAVWQSMYPNGVPIGSEAHTSFSPNPGNENPVGYGNLYFFFDRANITKAFSPNRDLTAEEGYYATLYKAGLAEPFYESTSTIGFNYTSGDNETQEYEYNPQNWDPKIAKRDATKGRNLPPNCMQEGETFFGIPLSYAFQEQFDFEYLVDQNYTYVESFGTSQGWFVGEKPEDSVGSIVDKDAAHIPLFYTGTTNLDMGGIPLESLVTVGRSIKFDTIFIKPAFVFIDEYGSIKLQFEADAKSALGNLYNKLCQRIGISWKGQISHNGLGHYTNCAMHSAGDRAKFGCGPENGKSGGFCPQMTLAYDVRFRSNEHAAAYIETSNNYVDYWRTLYPSGVAAGISDNCPEGGCLGLFLNRYDVYEVFKPDLGGSTPGNPGVPSPEGPGLGAPPPGASPGGPGQAGSGWGDPSGSSPSKSAKRSPSKSSKSSPSSESTKRGSKKGEGSLFK